MFKKGQKLKIQEATKRGLIQTRKGRICAVTEHFIVLQTKHYKECFAFVDLTNGRYVYE